MLIRVTADHIARGDSCSTYACPVALALIEAGFDRPRVMFDHVATYDCIDVLLSKEVQTFIDRVDTERKVEPFEFEITLPVRSTHAYQSNC